MTVDVDPAAQGRKSMGIWFLLVVVIVGAVAGSWLLLKGRKEVTVRPGFDGLAAVAPAETQFFIAFDLRDQVDIKGLLDRLDAFKRQYPEIGKKFDDAERESGVTLRELARWIQPAGYLAVLPLPGQKSLVPAPEGDRNKPCDFLLVTPVADEDGARQTLQTLARKAKREVREVQQDGAPLLAVGTGDREFAFGVAYKHLWMGSGTAVIGRAIRAATGAAPRLSEEPYFMDARKRCPEERGIFIFASLRDTFKALGALPALKRYVDDRTLEALDGLEYGVTAQDMLGKSTDSQCFLKVDTKSQSPFVKALLSAQPLSPTLMQFFPRQWGAYQSVNLVYLGSILYRLADLFPATRYQVGNLPTLATTFLGFNLFNDFQAISSGDFAYASDGIKQLPSLFGQSFARARGMGQLTACKSNLKNIGTAAEMFATDHGGKYPQSTSELVPNYLKTIPTCPAAGADTYSATWKAATDPDRFEVACGGNHHADAGLGENSPAYDSKLGLTGDASSMTAPAVPRSTFVVALSLKDVKAAGDLIAKLEEKGRQPSHVVRQIAGNDVHGYDRLPAEWTLLSQPQPVLLLAFGPDADKRLEEAIDSPEHAAVSMAAETELQRLIKEAPGKVVQAEFADLTPLLDWASSVLDQPPAGVPPEAAPLLAALKERVKDLSPMTVTGVTSVDEDGIHLRNRGAITPMTVGAVAIAAAIAVPNFIRARAQGQVTACKSNLKNIGTACEMYATDHHGRYPTSTADLTPDYLKVIPTCPAAGRDTYSEGFVSHAQPDAYTVVCTGMNHNAVGDGPNFPQYTSTQGLLDR